jgi:hypothetical protein
MEWEPLLALVEATFDEKDEGLFTELLAELERVQKEPERHPGTQEVIKDDDGQVVYKMHAFVSWLYGLQTGSFRLPVRMPREILQGFMGNPWLLCRCEDCLAWLPNLFQLSWLCPVCGGETIEQKDISGNDIDGWDPPWIFTPYGQRRAKMKRMRQQGSQ